MLRANTKFQLVLASQSPRRKELLSHLGIKFEVSPNLSIEDGINSVRTVFNRLWIDKVKCDRAISGLKNYKKEWDEKNKVFRNNPKHDWASHPADALRTFGVCFKENIVQQMQKGAGGVKPFFQGLPG